MPEEKVKTDSRPGLERFYGTIEIARIAGVSRGTVLDWIETGQLPARKFGTGRAWHVAESELRSFLKVGSPCS